jgi:hypothetical protein
VIGGRVVVVSFILVGGVEKLLLSWLFRLHHEVLLV